MNIVESQNEGVNNTQSAVTKTDIEQPVKKKSKAKKGKDKKSSQSKTTTKAESKTKKKGKETKAKKRTSTTKKDDEAPQKSVTRSSTKSEKDRKSKRKSKLKRISSTCSNLTTTTATCSLSDSIQEEENLVETNESLDPEERIESAVAQTSTRSLSRAVKEEREAEKRAELAEQESKTRASCAASLLTEDREKGRKQKEAEQQQKLEEAWRDDSQPSTEGEKEENGEDEDVLAQFEFDESEDLRSKIQAILPPKYVTRQASTEEEREDAKNKFEKDKDKNLEKAWRDDNQASTEGEKEENAEDEDVLTQFEFDESEDLRSEIQAILPKKHVTRRASTEEEREDAKKKFEKDKDKKVNKYKKEIKAKEKDLDKKEKSWEKELAGLDAEALKAEEERDAVLEEIAKAKAKIAAKIASIPTLGDKDKKKLKDSTEIIAYLRKENKKLRNSTTQLRKDFDTMQENNKRLLEANAYAGASFEALNEQSRNNNRNNSKLMQTQEKYKEQNQKLKEDLRMRQGYYDAEAEIRVNYQKSMAEIMEMIQDQCDDAQLTEDILVLALECESEAKSELADAEAGY
jgi:hypothetical protein